MPDVAKLKKRALEFEHKKQFDKALDAYTQVLAQMDEHVEEADVSLYNRVGDLLLRRGDVAQAVDLYEKAVDLYTDGGFFNNAIALCNKILRNAPGRNTIYYKLGKISARKGFINDAKQNFLEYADRMQKSGQLEEAFRALKEFADLCPDQDDIRLMLADQLVRKDRKSEAIEQLHALYDKFSAEGRSAEARATVDRMKALDPALEPQDTARPVPTKRDLVFLDVNYDEPSRPISATPAQTLDLQAPVAKAPTPWTVVHPTAPSGTPVVSNDLPMIYPPEEIFLELDPPRPAETAEVPGPSHGALVPENNEAATENLVSHVDLGFITGFEDSSVPGEQAPMDVAPLAELESHSLLEPSERNDAASLGEREPSMIEEFELEDMPSVELTPLDVERAARGSSELPMLDVELDDDESPLGGALTFISLDAEPADAASLLDGSTSLSGEMSDFGPAADLELERGLEPPSDFEHAAEVELSSTFESASDLEPGPSLGAEVTGEATNEPASPSSHEQSTEAFDVDRFATLDMEMTDPDVEASAHSHGLEIENASEFEDDVAFAGLPMLDADLRVQPPDTNDADALAQPESELNTVEELQRAEELEGAPEPHVAEHAEIAEAPVADEETSRHSAPVPVQPLPRIEQLRLEVTRHPTAWDLHRQLAEALLEEGDRGGGIAELEETMFGYEREGDLANASHSADELIRVEPNAVRYHQKRVEYAVRANDKAQLVDAYLSLAESLFRSGQLDKSRAVYGRVFELSPGDERAAFALRELGGELDLPMAETPSFASAAAHAPDNAPVDDEHVSTPTPVSVSAVSEVPPLPLAVELERATSTLAMDDELFAALETELPEQPHRAPLSPPPRPALTPIGDDDFVNLADWLRDEEPPKSTRMVVAGEEEPEEQQAFADMLTKFKQGVSSNVDDTDHESHYDLGIAYKEMGLLDEAISEFQKALRGTDHRARTYEALGQCFIEKRQYQIAMTILLRALNDAAASDDTLVGVLYLLGYASESLQKWEDALRYYERVFTVDIQFRDVGERLSAVERKAK